MLDVTSFKVQNEIIQPKYFGAIEKEVLRNFTIHTILKRMELKIRLHISKTAKFHDDLGSYYGLVYVPTGAEKAITDKQRFGNVLCASHCKA